MTMPTNPNNRAKSLVPLPTLPVLSEDDVDEIVKKYTQHMLVEAKRNSSDVYLSDFLLKVENEVLESNKHVLAYLMRAAIWWWYAQEKQKQS